MVTNSDLLTLKQLGYCATAIENLCLKNPEITLKELISLLDKQNPKNLEKKGYSLGWRPSEQTITTLTKSGYIKQIIDFYSAEFLFNISQLDINPVSLDAYFSTWLKRKLKPVICTQLDKWVLEQQVKIALNNRLISNDRIHYLEKKYKSSHKNEIKLHGFIFYNFAINHLLI